MGTRSTIPVVCSSLTGHHFAALLEPLLEGRTNASQARAAPLQSLRNGPIFPIVLGVRRVSISEPSTPQKAVELLLDESRQALPLPHPGGLGTERLDMIAHEI